MRNQVLASIAAALVVNVDFLATCVIFSLPNQPLKKENLKEK